MNLNISKCVAKNQADKYASTQLIALAIKKETKQFLRINTLFS